MAKFPTSKVAYRHVEWAHAPIPDVGRNTVAFENNTIGHPVVLWLRNRIVSLVHERLLVANTPRGHDAIPDKLTIVSAVIIAKRTFFMIFPLSLGNLSVYIIQYHFKSATSFGFSCATNKGRS